MHVIFICISLTFCFSLLFIVLFYFMHSVHGECSQKCVLLAAQKVTSTTGALVQSTPNM